MAKFSKSSGLLLVAYIFGTCSFAFGFNAIFNPVLALSFFEFDYPAEKDTRNLVDVLLLIYGIRDIYMGIATLTAAYYKQTKTLGILILATGSVAIADGAVCYHFRGAGHWNHWPLAPFIMTVGVLFLGLFDT